MIEKEGASLTVDNNGSGIWSILPRRQWRMRWDPALGVQRW
ncbi:hypothetical protein [Klebsiella variicola]|nr:hypothetical protein [Klebsiella variicola]